MLDRRTLITAAAAGAALPLLTPGDALGAPVAGRVLARGLQIPWGLAFLPSGDALVGERVNGRVHRVSRRGGRTHIGTIPIDSIGEAGLLGIAVSPTFRRDRFVYFYHSTRDDNRITRRRLVRGELGPPQVLLSGIPKASIHNGGRIAFGPGGNLFASTGDVANGSLAQDTGSLAGKILRINPDGSVPASNPFGNPVWSYGHRNVQGLAWDRRGRLWASELGQSDRDELNRIRRGRNYGWPAAEGRDDNPAYTDPFVTWRPEFCSPSGIAVARGRVWVGALRGECLWSVRLNGPNARKKVRHFAGDFGRIRTVQRAPDGSLWITTSNRDGRGDPHPNDDRVVRIRL